MLQTQFSWRVPRWPQFPQEIFSTGILGNLVSSGVGVVVVDLIYVYVYPYTLVNLTRDPPLTHGVHPKRVHPRRVELYVPAAKLELVETVKGQLDLDGSSLSAFCLEKIEEWWLAHKPGNPQTTLERYDVKAIPRPGFYDVAIGQFWYSQKKASWFRKTSLWVAPAGYSWNEVR
jgi:hypothetical protein